MRERERKPPRARAAAPRPTFFCFSVQFDISCTLSVFSHTLRGFRQLYIRLYNLQTLLSLRGYIAPIGAACTSGTACTTGTVGACTRNWPPGWTPGGTATMICWPLGVLTLIS